MNPGTSAVHFCVVILYYLAVFVWKTMDMSGLLSLAYQRGVDLSAECHGGTQSQCLYQISLGGKYAHGRML